MTTSKANIVQGTLIAGSLSLILAVAIGIPDIDGATKTVDQMGFTPIKVGGFAPFQCGQGDLFATRFSAKNSKGDTVNGVVCKGIFKGSTLRLD